MAYIDWNQGGFGRPWLQNATDAIGTVSGWTVMARDVLITTNQWLSVVKSTAGDFVVWMAVVGTNGNSGLRIGVAEDFDPATNTVLRIAWRSTAPAAVYADNSYTGSNWTSVTTHTSDGNFSAASTYSAYLTGAAVLDDFIAFNVGGAAAMVFDTALATPANDPVRIGGTVGTAFRPTRIPLAGSLPSPQGISGTTTSWVSGVLTSAADPYNTANPTAYLFTPVVFRHGAPVGQLRGSTKNLLWCGAGVAGEEVLIPGEGLYRKLAGSTTLWAKIAAGV